MKFRGTVMVAKCYDSIKNDTQIIVKKKSSSVKASQKEPEKPCILFIKKHGKIKHPTIAHSKLMFYIQSNISFFKLFFWLISSPNLVGLK